MGDEPKEYVRITQMDDGRLLIEPATVPTFVKETVDAYKPGDPVDDKPLGGRLKTKVPPAE